VTATPNSSSNRWRSGATGLPPTMKARPECGSLPTRRTAVDRTCRSKTSSTRRWLTVGWTARPRSVDDTRSQRLITPRRLTSAWSRVNKQRVERLIATGRMTTAGLAAIETAKRNGAWTALDDIETLTEPTTCAPHSTPTLPPAATGTTSHDRPNGQSSSGSQPPRPLARARSALPTRPPRPPSTFAPINGANPKAPSPRLVFKGAARTWPNSPEWSQEQVAPATEQPHPLLVSCASINGWGGLPWIPETAGLSRPPSSAGFPRLLKSGEAGPTQSRG
jgi:hypothetical protein